MTWRGEDPPDGRIESHELQLGDRVWYRDLNDGVVESTVQRLVHDRDRRVIAFHAGYDSAGVSIPLDRVVKARRATEPAAD